jgi:aryl-alcohol dehydrogenase-like predicted oxidoreductase
MLYRTLGRTGIKVSLAGLGTGGPSKLGQSTGRTALESHRIVHRALDLGINLFDSSPAYGVSEELLGGALQGVPRDRYIIATKFALRDAQGIKSDPQALMQQLEQSLARLGVDAVDVLQYHGVGPDVYRQVVDRFHSVALRAQEQGKVRFIGITETSDRDPEHVMLEAALRENLFDTFMVKYGILNQSAARVVFPLALEHNVGVFIMASVRTSLRSPEEAVGRLNGFIDQGVLAISPPFPDDPLGLGAAGGEIPSLTRAAYQFAARPEAVSTVLIGTGNVAHLEANVADLLGPRLSEAQFAHLERAFGSLTWNA